MLVMGLTLLDMRAFFLDMNLFLLETSLFLLQNLTTPTICKPATYLDAIH